MAAGNGYIGIIHINDNDTGGTNYKIGSTLFTQLNNPTIGSITTTTTTNTNDTKLFTVPLTGFSLTDGVTVHVQFKNAWSGAEGITCLKLKVGNSDAKEIKNPNGALTWNEDAVISFTYDGQYWIMNSSQVTGASLSGVNFGNITSEGKLGTASMAVVTDGNKLVTTADLAVSDPTSNGTATDFIATISLNSQGKINVTKKEIPTVSSSTKGLAPKGNTVNTQTLSTKFLREDGSWQTPSYTTNTDTHVNVTLGTTTKAYLLGISTTPTSTALALETISDTGVFLNTTAGQLEATSFKGSGANLTSLNASNINDGTLAVTYGGTGTSTANANKIFAGPTSGNAAAPSFRSLVSADIPTSVALTGTPTAPTIATATDSSTSIATTAFVLSAINNKLASNDAMLFKGTIGTGGTITTVPNGKSNNSSAPVDLTYLAGYTYRVITAGTYAGKVCEVGDLLIAIHDSTNGQTAINNDHWTVAQTNIDGALYKGSTYSSGQLLVAGDSGAVSTSGFTLAAPVAAGDILYASSTTAYSILTKGTTGLVLTINSSGLPDWADNSVSSSWYVNGTSGGSTTNAAVNSGSTYIHLYNDTTKSSTITLTGDGGTTITATNSRVITIKSKKYKSTDSTNALTSLSLEYYTDSTLTSTLSANTTTQIGYVDTGILYIKGIKYGTTSVSTGVSEDTTNS